MSQSIRVEDAFGENYAVSGMSFNWTHLSVKVKNIAYEKKVQLHYKKGEGVPWDYADINFTGHYGDYDIFAGPPSLPWCHEFVVKYTVDGQEYWDNNEGLNYHIDTFRGVIGGNVVLNKASTWSYYAWPMNVAYIEGEIYVQNLSYHKKVGIRYTKDGGLTWQDVDAQYIGPILGNAANILDTEVWGFRTPNIDYDPSSSVYKLAAYYEIRDSGPNYGLRFWDNNFNQDYTISKYGNPASIE